MIAVRPPVVPVQLVPDLDPFLLLRSELGIDINIIAIPEEWKLSPSGVTFLSAANAPDTSVGWYFIEIN